MMTKLRNRNPKPQAVIRNRDGHMMDIGSLSKDTESDSRREAPMSTGFTGKSHTLLSYRDRTIQSLDGP
jgi:hypothetical protein